MKAFRKHPLHAKSLFGIGCSAAFAASLIAMAGSSAQAESPADTSQAVQPSAVPGHPEPQLEEVVVTGIRASLERAMDIKRDADVVVDSISAEDIGKFPDSNVADSLQRITGVAIDLLRPLFASTRGYAAMWPAIGVSTLLSVVVLRRASST